MPQILIFGMHWCLAAPTWIDKTNPRKCLCLTDMWIFQTLSWIPFLSTSVTAALIFFPEVLLATIQRKRKKPQEGACTSRYWQLEVV